MNKAAKSAIAVLALLSVVLAWSTAHFYRQYLLHRGIALDEVVTDENGRQFRKYIEIEVESRHRKQPAFIVDGREISLEQLRGRIAAHARSCVDEMDARFSKMGVFVAFLGQYDHEALKKIIDICDSPGVGIAHVKMITAAMG